MLAASALERQGGGGGVALVASTLERVGGAALAASVKESNVSSHLYHLYHHLFFNYLHLSDHYHFYKKQHLVLFYK